MPGLLWRCKFMKVKEDEEEEEDEEEDYLVPAV